MSDDNNFDPRQYPELFGDDDLNPLEMALLMEMLGSNPETPIQPSSTTSPVRTSLFSNEPQSRQIPQMLNIEDILALNPGIMQMLDDAGDINLTEEEMMAPVPGLFDALNDFSNHMEQTRTDLKEEYGINESPEEEPIDVSEIIPVLDDKPIIETEIKTKPEIKIEELTYSEPEIKEVKKPSNPYVKHKKSNRCNMIECKSKMGLLGFECKCGYKFCSKHRHTDTHYCTYDHASNDKRRLKEANPQIIADKIANRL